MSQPRTTLLDHKHPTVLIEILRSLNDRAGQPTGNRAYAEHERGLERWGWQQCPGELIASTGKLNPCRGGEVKRGKYRIVCPACHGKGGWYGDPYDNDQITIHNGHQRPSTFTVSDFAELVLTIDARGPVVGGAYSIDRACWTLEARNSRTSTITENDDEKKNKEPWCYEQMRLALDRLASLQPGWYGLLRRLYIERTSPHQPITDLERHGAGRALALVARLLPDAYRVPDWLRERAQEAA